MVNTRKKNKHGKKYTRKRAKKHTTYSNKDYSSGEGMLTSVWGPSLWHYLHTMSFNYPVNPTKEDRHYYKHFIMSLKYVLPCKYCRINLKNNFKECPLTNADMKNRETFSHYVYRLHELINKMLDKKSNLTYKEVRERYEHFRSRCTEKHKIFNFTKKTLKKREKGCTEPLYGKKSKCVIKIIPQDHNEESFQMDEKCIKYR
jgi:hypothetical protein